jgi:hypothetical protein
MIIAKAFLTGIILMTAAVIYAAPIDNVTSSAFMPGDSAIFNLDFGDPFGLPFFNVMIDARNANDAQTRIIPMTHADPDPHYLTTYIGSAVFDTPAATIEYFGRVEADTFVLTQSYKNTANQFPPDSILYARLANDAVGDTAPGSAGQFLDLTGGAITYSDTKLFVKLNNAGGGWPRNQGFSTYFVYGFFLGDPDTVSLSVTAMVYSNVPLLLPSGLYHVNLADTSFQQLGNIQSQTSGNTLHMSCNIADLLTDPNWPVWPPQRGFILGFGFTLTVDISGGITFNDYSYPSAFMPMTQYLSTVQNHAPVAYLIFTLPVGRDSLYMQVSYHDMDNNLPVIRDLTFEGITYTLGSFQHQYVSPGSEFNIGIPWPGDGWHQCNFVFSDGADTAATNIDSVYLEPLNVNEPDVPQNYQLSQNYPNPFNAQTSISFVLPKASDVNLAVFDITGRDIADLADGCMNAGQHSVIWDGKNEDGQPASSGLYFYRLNIDGADKDTKRMILLK